MGNGSLLVAVTYAWEPYKKRNMRNAYEVSFLWAASRGFGAAMVHTTTSLMVAYGLSYCKVRKKTFLIGTYALLLCAMVFHGVYNMLVQSDKYMYFGFLLPTITFIPLAVSAFRHREQKK